jgi:hypothetical protein
MLMLSGYTLGFFFPKQARYLPVPDAAAGRDLRPSERDEARQDAQEAEPERSEIPAGYYFYRYF